MADRDLAGHQPQLAAKVDVVSGQDVRLVKLDRATREDRFYVLQVLKDRTVNGNPKSYYCYHRHGITGSRGVITVSGPTEQPKAAAEFARTFKMLTGADFGSIKPGDVAKAGMHYLQHQAQPDKNAKWQYFVGDGVDGKRTGWYPYDAPASAEVEELYAQHVASGRDARTTTRHVSSGHWQYEVDLDKMKQTNTSTKTVRTIRRASGKELDEARGAAQKRVHAAMKMAMQKAMKKMPMKAMKKMPMKARDTKTVKKVMKKAMKKVVKKATKKIAAMKKRVPTTGHKFQVFNGTRKRTSGMLKKDDLMKNKRGKVVGKRGSAHGRRQFSNIANWVAALSAARKALGLRGFVPIKAGSAFYAKAKALAAGRAAHAA